MLCHGANDDRTKFLAQQFIIILRPCAYDHIIPTSYYLSKYLPLSHLDPHHLTFINDMSNTPIVLPRPGDSEVQRSAAVNPSAV
ncbi:hypothetical protein BDV29DRAFT_34082 [Aspergillus leporis]|jgi:hypothetical protein|uniref:Uncharacterized protein n=1 Tax=Aspergillus leporis TaxID=41062 RepID=A0A5N5WQ49_9EURO|nr:hypothetical protein BDV29DRAFT_34082 [Aspergillus leporis]